MPHSIPRSVTSLVHKFVEAFFFDLVNLGFVLNFLISLPVSSSTSRSQLLAEHVKSSLGNHRLHLDFNQGMRSSPGQMAKRFRNFLFSFYFNYFATDPRRECLTFLGEVVLEDVEAEGV